MSGRCHIAEQPDLHKRRSGFSHMLYILLPDVKIRGPKYSIFFGGTSVCLYDTIWRVWWSAQRLLLMLKRTNAVTSYIILYFVYLWFTHGTVRSSQ